MIVWHHHALPVGSSRWCGEYWPDDADTGVPWGVCWVADYPPPMGPALLYVLVADDCRRQGIATMLIAAACKRWPGIWITEGVTPEGEALYDSLVI